MAPSGQRDRIPFSSCCAALVHRWDRAFASRREDTGRQVEPQGGGSGCPPHAVCISALESPASLQTWALCLDPVSASCSHLGTRLPPHPLARCSECQSTCRLLTWPGPPHPQESSPSFPVSCPSPRRTRWPLRRAFSSPVLCHSLATPPEPPVLLPCCSPPQPYLCGPFFLVWAASSKAASGQGPASSPLPGGWGGRPLCGLSAPSRPCAGACLSCALRPFGSCLPSPLPKRSSEGLSHPSGRASSFSWPLAFLFYLCGLALHSLPPLNTQHAPPLPSPCDPRGALRSPSSWGPGLEPGASCRKSEATREQRTRGWDTLEKRQGVFWNAGPIWRCPGLPRPPYSLPPSAPAPSQAETVPRTGVAPAQLAVIRGLGFSRRPPRRSPPLRKMSPCFRA